MSKLTKSQSNIEYHSSLCKTYFNTFSEGIFSRVNLMQHAVHRSAQAGDIEHEVRSLSSDWGFPHSTTYNRP